MDLNAIFNQNFDLYDTNVELQHIQIHQHNQLQIPSSTNHFISNRNEDTTWQSQHPILISNQVYNLPNEQCCEQEWRNGISEFVNCSDYDTTSDINFSKSNHGN